MAIPSYCCFRYESKVRSDPSGGWLGEVAGDWESYGGSPLIRVCEGCLSLTTGGHPAHYYQEVRYRVGPLENHLQDGDLLEVGRDGAGCSTLAWWRGGDLWVLFTESPRFEGGGLTVDGPPEREDRYLRIGGNILEVGQSMTYESWRLHLWDCGPCAVPGRKVQLAAFHSELSSLRDMGGIAGTFMGSFESRRNPRWSVEAWSDLVN